MNAEVKKKNGKRKSSQVLPLVLVASASVVGCGSNESAPVDLVADEYENIEDCQKDWGHGTECQPKLANFNPDAASASAASNTASTFSGSGGGHAGGSSGFYHRGYYGPHYVLGDRANAQSRFGVSSSLNSSTDHAVARSFSRGSGSSVGRGGFGSSAHASSGGG